MHSNICQEKTEAESTIKLKVDKAGVTSTTKSAKPHDSLYFICHTTLFLNLKEILGTNQNQIEGENTTNLNHAMDISKAGL